MAPTPNLKEPTMAQVMTIQFWQDVFKAALGNPQVVKDLGNTKVSLIDQLAILSDYAVSHLKQRL